MKYSDQEDEAVYTESPDVFLSNQIKQLVKENKDLQAALRESRNNDRIAMSYLEGIRVIVGGKNFPEMVRNVQGLVTALQTIAAWKSHSLKLAVDQGSNGVRDFYRSIAKSAITNKEASHEAPDRP